LTLAKRLKVFDDNTNKSNNNRRTATAASEGRKTRAITGKSFRVGK
jgi:hypothetical protein